MENNRDKYRQICRLTEVVNTNEIVTLVDYSKLVIKTEKGVVIYKSKDQRCISGNEGYFFKSDSSLRPLYKKDITEIEGLSNLTIKINSSKRRMKRAA